MLLLTRGIGEKIMIGDDIELTVLGVKDGDVKLGITAPAEVLILREEIANRIDLKEDQEKK